MRLQYGFGMDAMLIGCMSSSFVAQFQRLKNVMRDARRTLQPAKEGESDFRAVQTTSEGVGQARMFGTLMFGRSQERY